MVDERLPPAVLTAPNCGGAAIKEVLWGFLFVNAFVGVLCGVLLVAAAGWVRFKAWLFTLDFSIAVAGVSGLILARTIVEAIRKISRCSSKARQIGVSPNVGP